MRLILYALAILLVGLGIYVKLYPHILLKLHPKYGFIPYMIVTGGVSPPYMQNDAWHEMEFAKWIKPNDVVVASAVKSGTTMLLYVSHLIRVKGDVGRFPFKDVNVNCPWPTFRMKPGQTWEEVKDLMNTTTLYDGTLMKDFWDNPDYPYRVFKSHETPVDPQFKLHSGVLEVRKFPQVKFVAMVRDYADVLASFYPFTGNHDDDFRAMWGGFPPPFESIKVFFDFVFAKDFQDMFLGYTKAWYKVRNDPNVLLLHYNDAIKDLSGLVRILAQFYGTALTESEVNKIASMANVKEMQKHSEIFSYLIWGNKDFKNGRGYCMKHGKQIRKGVSNDHKVLFDESQIAKIREIETEYFKESPEILSWQRQGGSFEL